MLLGTHENIFDSQLKTLAFIFGKPLKGSLQNRTLTGVLGGWLCLLCGNRLAEVEHGWKADTSYWHIKQTMTVLRPEP